MSPPRAGRQSGRASLLSIVGLAFGTITVLAFFSPFGCATVKPIIASVEACSEANVASAVGDISATVTTILESGGSSWQTQLAGLGLTIGKLEVACAVQAVTSHLQATLPEHGEGDPKVLTAVTRGHTWLFEQDITALQAALK